MRTKRPDTTSGITSLERHSDGRGEASVKFTAPGRKQGQGASWPRAPGGDSDPNRREFLKTSVVAALSGLLASQMACGVRVSGTAPRPAGSGEREQRDLLFDFSHIETDDHDLIVIAGTRRFRIKETSPGQLRKLRQKYPVLEAVPDENATHYLSADFPANDWQTCYVKRFRRGEGKTSKGNNDQSQGNGTDKGIHWELVSWFDHVPEYAVRQATELIQGGLAAGELPPVSAKWARFGLTGEDILAVDDPVSLEVIKTSEDCATAIVNKHPELVCGDPCTKQVIDQVISPRTSQMAQLINALGPGKEQDNWVDCSTPVRVNTGGSMPGYGTLIPVCNPDTGQRATNTSGDYQYTVEYHPSLNSSATGVIRTSLQAIKDDPTFGTNDTNNPDQAAGIIYRYGDGMTTSDQSDDGLGAGSGLSYTTKDYSPGSGYSSEVQSVDASTDSGIDVDVTILVRNWYVRYLGVYVRYYDENGNVLSVGDTPEAGAVLSDRSELQEAVGELWNTRDDYLIDLLAPEKEILGIPAGDKVNTYKIPLPDNATSFSLLASGMGTSASNTNPFFATTIPGGTMTGIFNLCLPTFFLALNAAAGVAKMLNALSEDSQQLLEIAPLALELFADTFEAVSFNEPSAYLGIAKEVGEELLSSEATKLVKFVITYLSEGETQDDLLDAIPVIGGFLAMVQAVGTIAQIAETSAQVLNSPSTYRKDVQLTHDIDVVIKGDPNDAGQWPSTATSFKTVLLFDGGTPTSLTQQIPGSTVDTQAVTFKAVPLGGIVTASVQVYSETGFQVGVASVGPIDNILPGGDTPLTIDVTLTELQVPLTASTVYFHKEVMALDEDGNHVWNPSAMPPVQEPSGCNSVDGELCELTGITVNTTAGDVGQTFQSASKDVKDCVSGASGQTHTFSNAATSANPQESFFYSACGFDQPPRLVYDVVNNRDFNFYLDTSSARAGYRGGIIRQVRLTRGSEGFDQPDSNKAWGKLQFPSNAFLLHPGRKIISINSTYAKIEVVDLPEAPVPDDAAPLSNAYGGRGLREGLMNAPVLAALAPDGTVLVLESENKRIQAFDLNANPAKKFGTARADYFFELRAVTGTPIYVDFAVEFEGYMYVLWQISNNYTLDIYDPTGNYLASTFNFVGQKMAVNYWRDIFTQNSVALKLPTTGVVPDARTEPAISRWIPST